MSNIVQEVCKELGINQTELARELGVTTGAISQWNKEIPKLARKALEYKLELHRQKKYLKFMKEFKQFLKEI